jgi:hypothetical protein
MLLRDRVDGRRVRDLAPFNLVMPYLMRGRNESIVYFSMDVDVENAMRYVHRKNAAAADPKYSLFGIVIAAAARTIALKPRLNRFVHRRALYQRDEIAVSFLVKKKLVERAGEANAKIRFDPQDGLDLAMDRIRAGIEGARSDAEAPEVREVAMADRIPGGKALVTALFRLLDRYNVAPAWMIRNDPLFTSAFFANLGSIGLDAPYHHLYEWGTASLFVVMGRMCMQEPSRAGRGAAGEPHHFVNIKISVDERIADGIYFSHAASLFQRLIGQPELLEERPDLTLVET